MQQLSATYEKSGQISRMLCYGFCVALGKLKRVYFGNFFLIFQKKLVTIESCHL